MVLLGLLVTKLLTHEWPLSAEDGVDRFLAAHRVGWANTATNALSTLANTFGAAAVALVAVVWARWRSASWREPLYLVFSVLLELAVFLVTTLLVHRPRPSVLELDTSPPTSSFPSGHTAAAVTLYGAVALILFMRTRRKSYWLLLLIPAAVGVARLYRGMHHPSDVAAGALLGALCVWAAWLSVLRTPDAADEIPAPRTAAGVASSSARQLGATVLIVNGTKADEAATAHLLDSLAAICAQAGRPAPRAVRTTPAEHGAGLAREAVAAGARLVVACGGDGTVSEVASALAGTDVALGIIPLGTGNLLAANLGIPTKPEEALAVLADGADQRMDVGRIDGHIDGQNSGRIFLGMAGAGLDSAMIEDAPEGLKRRAGWAAYAVAAARHLPDRIPAVTVHVDGRRTRHRDVSTLLVGNIGRLQAGLEPLPDAEVDDGLLDLAVVAPHGPLGWLRVFAALRRARPGTANPVVYRARGQRISIRTRRPVPREADGEALPAAARTEIEVWQAALTVRVPRPEAAERTRNAATGTREAERTAP